MAWQRVQPSNLLGPDDAAQYDKIKDTLFNRVKKHSVDGEVATFRIFLGCAKLDAFGATAIKVGPLGPKCSHFDMASLF